jgi:LysR family glycine cleavage system transcriptional activator
MEHPDIELMLNPTAELVELAPGGVDVAIRFGDGNWPGLEAEPLLLTNFVIVAATSLVGTEPFPDPARIYEFPGFRSMAPTNWRFGSTGRALSPSATSMSCICRGT